jgi:predicted Ser/Thr protein kinase
MTPEQIREAIAADAELQALAKEAKYEEIAKLLSAGRKVYVSTMVSARGLAPGWA